MQVNGKAHFHAIDLEQCALFVDSAPLKKSMTDAAGFLRSLSDPRPGAGDASGVEAVSGPWRGEFGALHHEDMTGFVFTVSPPKFDRDVAHALNVLAAISASPAATRGEPFGYVVDGQFFQSDPGALNGKVAVYTQPAAPPVPAPAPADGEAVLRRVIHEIVESVEMEVDLSLRPMLRKRIEAAKALLDRPAARSEPAAEMVRALPYLIHFVRQRWQGEFTYTVEEAMRRWISGEFREVAAEEDAKAALTPEAPGAQEKTL